MDNSWQTTSRHVRQLEEAGLITVGLQGRERVYSLDSAFMLDALDQWGDRFRS
jgi:DNA-binding transcriptional ArsR family regulator